MTHREYLTWQAWLDLQWNEPDRSDHYAMQITQAIRQILNKNTVTLDQQKIPFDIHQREEEEEEEDSEKKAVRVAAATRVAKSRWWGVASRGKRRQKPNKRK